MRFVLAGAGVILGVMALVAIIGTLLPVAHVAARKARYRRSLPEVFGVIEAVRDLPAWNPATRKIEVISDLAADGEGTLLTITERGEVYNPIFRFVSKFLMGQTKSMDEYLRALGRKFGEEVTPIDGALMGVPGPVVER